MSLYRGLTFNATSSDLIQRVLSLFYWIEFE